MDSYKKQLLCRVGFLAFCCLPTLLVIVTILLPDPDPRWAEVFSHEMRAKVHVAASLKPRPGLTLLREVSLSDPGGVWIGETRAMEIDSSGSGVHVRFNQPHFSTAAMPILMNAIDEHLLNSGSKVSLPVAFEIPHMTIQPAGERDRGETLANVHCLASESADGYRWEARFSLVADEQGEPCHLVVERTWSQQHAELKWSLDTKEHTLPCWLLQSLVPALRYLGEDCCFVGRVEGKFCNDGTRLQLSGRFDRVDLYDLVQRRFPHTLTGLATVDFATLTVEQGRIVEARGSIQCGRGSVSESLLNAVCEHLDCQLLAEKKSSVMPYGALSCNFQVTRAELKLRGSCPSQSHTMLQGIYGEPLLATNERPVPLVAIARVLVPATSVQVPLTKETASFLSLFPLPSTALPTKQTPTATLRLDD